MALHTMAAQPTTEYEQFVYGKLAEGVQDFGVVGQTSELAAQDIVPDELTRNYNFVGQSSSASLKAVGVFPYKHYVVFAYARNSERDSTGAVATDAQGRMFNQHRYIMVPLGALENGAFQPIKAVPQLAAQYIPIFNQLHQDLARATDLAVIDRGPDVAVGRTRRLGETLSRKDQAGRPLVLVLLQLLLEDRRLFITSTPTLRPSELLESVFDLLPNVLRTRIPLAIGLFDHRHCPWARVMMKYNDPGPAVNEQIVWYDHINNQFPFEPKPSLDPKPSLEFSGYLALIEKVVDNPDRLDALLAVLDAINNDPIIEAAPGQMTERASLKDELNGPRLPLQLIKVLPLEEQNSVCDAILASFDRIMLLQHMDDILRLELDHRLWHELRTRTLHPDKEESKAGISLLLELWKRYSPEQRATRIQIMARDDLLLGKFLLERNLIAHHGPADWSDNERKHMRELVVNVVRQESLQNRAQARVIVEAMIESKVFADQGSTFLLSDALNQPGNSAQAWSQLRKPPYGWLELTRSEFDKTHTGEALRAGGEPEQALGEHVRVLLEQHQAALDHLPQIAQALERGPSQVAIDRQLLYQRAVELWNPAAPLALPLLRDLTLRRKSAASGQEWRWREGIGDLVPWVEVRLPQLAASFDRAAQDLNVDALNNLAAQLVPQQADHLDTFDQLIGQHAAWSESDLIALLRIWIEQSIRVQPADTSVLQAFEQSAALRVLRRDGPAPLKAALPLLAGAPDVAKLPVASTLHELGKALSLPDELLYTLVERVALRVGEHLTVAQIGELLEFYLKPNPTSRRYDGLLQSLEAKGEKALADIFRHLVATRELPPEQDLLQAVTANTVVIVARWLAKRPARKLLRGPLLSLLIDAWYAAPPPADSALLKVLQSPMYVTDLANYGQGEQLRSEDILQICRLHWLTKINKPVILPKQVQTDYPSNGNPEDKHPDFDRGFVATARSFLQQAKSPDDVKLVLQDAYELEVNHDTCEQLLLDLRPHLWSLRLVFDGLENNRLNEATRKRLSRIALGLRPNAEAPQESSDLEKLMRDELSLGLQQFDTIAMRDLLVEYHTIVADRELYLRALGVVLADEVDRRPLADHGWLIDLFQALDREDFPLHEEQARVRRATARCIQRYTKHVEGQLVVKAPDTLSTTPPAL